MSLVIFNGTLTSAFVPSQPWLIKADAVVLDFSLVVGAPGTNIEWYLEYAAAPAGPWFRETAQEDAGGGVVTTPIVVRTFKANGGAALGPGTHQLSAQMIRRHQLVRAQMRVAAGSAAATVSTPFGEAAATP